MQRIKNLMLTDSLMFSWFDNLKQGRITSSPSTISIKVLKINKNKLIKNTFR